MRGSLARVLPVALLVSLACAPSARGVDVAELVARATENDLELKKLSLNRRMAELRVAQIAASRGWKLGIGPHYDGLAISAGIDGSSSSVTFHQDQGVHITAPDPVNTSLYLCFPTTLTLSSGAPSITQEVSMGATQPLSQLFGADVRQRVRDYERTMSLFRIDAAVAARMSAVAGRVVASLKALIALRLRIGELSEQLLDIVEEEARTKALDPQGERGAAYRQIQQRKAGIEESLARAERELEVRTSRLEKELGVELGEELPTIPEVGTELPSEADGETCPAVRSAGLELALAETRLEEQALSRLPSLSAGASFDVGKGDTWPVALSPSISFSVSWQALDSGLRELNRQELATDVELKRLELEQARGEFSSSLADMELEVMDLTARAADAARNLELARSTLEETRVLVDKGLKKERDVTKATSAVSRRETEIQLVALDRYAFAERLKAMTLRFTGESSP